jgi:hypothetical protein
MLPTFQRNVLTPSSVSKNKLLAGCFLSVPLDAVDGDGTFFRNVGELIIPEHGTFYGHRCGNLKSNMVWVIQRRGRR